MVSAQGSNQAFELIGLNKLRNDPQFSQIDGSGLAVAVIDTGINSQHPLLKANYKYGYDFVNEDGNPNELFEHGTSVSGVIGAKDKQIGVAPEVGLIALKAGEPYFFNNDVLQSLQWVLANHQKYNIVAVNMSFGGGTYTSESQAQYDNYNRYSLIQQLEQAGITVVAAAGNSYYDAQYHNLASPAIYSTLAVGAVWPDNVGQNFSWDDGAKDYTTGADRIVSFSQRLNSDNMIFAPGGGINTTSFDGGLEVGYGTSLAAPHVAGAVALIQEAALEFAGRKFKPYEVAQVIGITAHQIYDGDDENDNVKNTGINYPRLDIYNAIVTTQARGYYEIAQYGASYTDVIATFGDDLKALAKHYRELGEREGRSRDRFDEFRYIASHSDLIATFKLDGDAATRHYIADGYWENRSPIAFNPSQYLAANGDLIKVYRYDTNQATRHYIQSGWQENRSTIFDASRYLASNPDIIQVLGKDRETATKHYIQTGYHEKRTISFDSRQYLASYPDLCAALGVNLAAATDHFVDKGHGEKRTRDLFDEYRYIASYADLINTFRIDGNAAVDHYLSRGMAEGRSIIFDPFSYMNLNPDVAASYRNDPLGVTLHYIIGGYDEGRKFI